MGCVTGNALLLIAELEDERGRELTEKEANLAVAQAKLVGDL